LRLLAEIRGASALVVFHPAALAGVAFVPAVLPARRTGGIEGRAHKKSHASKEAARLVEGEISPLQS
jgi:hypothetical protein